MSEENQEQQEVAEADVKDEVDAVDQQESDNSEAESLADQVVAQEKQKSQEYNWRKAREQLEELQYENRMLKRRFDEIEKPKGPSEQDQLQALEAEIKELDKDDLLTVEQAEKLAYLREKKSEIKLKKIEERLASKEARTLQMMIKADFPDFEKIATEENINELKRDPVFVKALNGLDDAYDKVQFINEQLKLRGFGKESLREKKQLEANLAKPKSTNSIGGASPLHMAQDFTDWPSPALQKQLNDEMVQAIRGA